MQICCIYLYVEVPLRIAYRPPTSYIDSWLAVDLFVDCFLFVNLICGFNVAYRNTASLWVGNRREILRHHLSNTLPYDFLAALPLDWLAFSIGDGGELHTVDLLRVFKWAALSNLTRESRQGLFSFSIVSPIMKLFRLALIIAAILHLCSCIWYAIGNSRATWTLGITWYRVLPTSEYFEEAPDYGAVFGTESSTSSTIPARYLLSLYHICSTVTTYGNIGFLTPQNYVEVLYTIAIIILNMTLMNFVSS